MKDIRIAYLGADDSADLPEFKNDKERNELIVGHENVELYTPYEFIDALNDGTISDLGYAVIIK